MKTLLTLLFLLSSTAAFASPVSCDTQEDLANQSDEGMLHVTRASALADPQISEDEQNPVPWKIDVAGCLLEVNHDKHFVFIKSKHQILYYRTSQVDSYTGGVPMTDIQKALDGMHEFLSRCECK